MIKRVTYKLRKGDVLIVQEYHDGKYGAKGLPRKKKKKATKEDIARVNKWNKTKRCQIRLLEYFEPNDLLVTWTYKVANRPATMKEAKKHFAEAMRKVRREIRKRGYDSINLFFLAKLCHCIYIRNRNHVRCICILSCRSIWVTITDDRIISFLFCFLYELYKFPKRSQNK